MTSKPIDQLGELQRAVLEVLWEFGRATVQDVLDHRDRPAARVHNSPHDAANLEKAGWAKHEQSGRAYVYLPARTRAQAEATTLRAFIKRAFAGDASLLFQTLLDEGQLTKKELAQLRAMIDAKRQGRSER